MWALGEAGCGPGLANPPVEPLEGVARGGVHDSVGVEASKGAVDATEPERQIEVGTKARDRAFEADPLNKEDGQTKWREV